MMSDLSGEQERDLRQRLSALRVDPEAGPFIASLHRRLVAAGAPPPAAPLTTRLITALRRHPLATGAGIGFLTATATFALLLLLIPQLFFREGNRSRDSGHTLIRALPAVTPNKPSIAFREKAIGAELPLDKVAVIRLHFKAEVAIEGVSFKIQLPEGLVFWNDGKQLAARSFAWMGALQSGENVIPIAVRALRSGSFRVVAVAQSGKQSMEHQVLFKVTESG
jgi:hypothetical protein